MDSTTSGLVAIGAGVGTRKAFKQSQQTAAVVAAGSSLLLNILNTGTTQNPNPNDGEKVALSLLGAGILYLGFGGSVGGWRLYRW